MARSRWVFLVAVALMIGAGCFLSYRPTERPVAQGGGSVDTGGDAAPSRMPDTASEPSGASRSSISALLRDGKLSGADYVRFNFGIKLREAGASLKFTAVERERLTEAYVACMLAKAAIESDLVQTLEGPAGELVLSIPSYPDEGAALKREFKKILAEVFPGPRADEIDDHFGRYFDERALGFGRTEQVLRITKETGGNYRIVRTSRLLPGATLSGYPESSPIGAIESTAIASFDQIRTGEYMAITAKLGESALAPARP